MRLSKLMLASWVSIGLAGGCAERPGKPKDDGKAAKGKKDKDKKPGNDANKDDAKKAE
jgi:hypothetical protein